MTAPIALFDELRDMHLRYLDSPFDLRYPDLVTERRNLLGVDGRLFRQPLIEPIPAYQSTNQTFHNIAHARLDGSWSLADIADLSDFGSLETTAALRVPPILAVFGRRFPEVQIVLMTGTTCSLIEEVLAYRLEAAFVAGPVCHPELKEKKTWTEELVLVTSPQFRSLDDALASSRPNIIVFREGCTYRERLERLLGERGITAVRRLEMGTVDGILGCARAGLGITLMPRGVASQAASKGEIGIHSLPKNQAFVQTVCVRRKGAVISAALDRFLESATTGVTISKG